jgi:hypothetical protein
MITKKEFKMDANTPIWLGFDCTKQQWVLLAHLSNRLDSEGIHLTTILPITKDNHHIGIEMLMEGRGKGFSLSLIGKTEKIILGSWPDKCKSRFLLPRRYWSTGQNAGHHSMAQVRL